MIIIFNWILSAVAIVIASYLLPGVHVDGFLTALVLAVVLGVLNAFIKPIFVVLTLPLTIVTLGLFALVLNALFILVAAQIVPGFGVDSFWWAFFFGIVLSLVNAFFNMLGDGR
jgi:putative membrane protein